MIVTTPWRMDDDAGQDDAVEWVAVGARVAWIRWTTVTSDGYTER